MINSFKNQLNILKSRAKKNNSQQSQSRGILFFNGNKSGIDGKFIYNLEFPSVVQFFTSNKKHVYVVNLNNNMSAMRIPRNNNKNVNVNTIKEGFNVSGGRSRIYVINNR